MHDAGYQIWVREYERRMRSNAHPHTHAAAHKHTIHGGGTQHQSLPSFSMAFQPIVNVTSGRAFAYEALVRSVTGEGAGTVFRRIPKKHFHSFDRACRSRAMTLAMECGLLDDPAALLCVNVNPNAAVTEASSIGLTCQEAREIGFPIERLVLEIVEDDQITDLSQLQRTLDQYRAYGVKVAMDDFGAGYSGLKMLSRLHPDIVKIDMALVSQIDVDRTAEIILRAIVQACFELGVEVVAEGVENGRAADTLCRIGVVLQQGYHIARPAFESLPPFTLPELGTTQAY